jgi:Icc protein
MRDLFSRRSVLKTSAVTLAAAAGGSLVNPFARGQQTPDLFAVGPKRVLRFAHPTDIHVQPELHGDRGMAAAFKHMFALKDPPEMILTGGDLPMDTASSDQARSLLGN